MGIENNLPATFLIVPGYTNSGPGHLHTAAGFGEWQAGEALIEHFSGEKLIVRSAPGTADHVI